MAQDIFSCGVAGHIVVVAEGKVHEFSSGKSGYDGGTAVADWLKPYVNTNLTVRKLSAKPSLAS